MKDERQEKIRELQKQIEQLQEEIRDLEKPRLSGNSGIFVLYPPYLKGAPSVVFKTFNETHCVPLTLTSDEQGGASTGWQDLDYLERCPGLVKLTEEDNLKVYNLILELAGI